MPISRAALVPVALFGLILAVNAVLAILAPAALRGEAMLAATTGILLGGYLVRPKAALIIFPVFMLFSMQLAHWFGPPLLFVDDVALIGFVVLAAWRTRPWQRGLISPVRDGALLAFFGVGVIASLVAGVPGAIWVASLVKLAALFAFFYVVLWHDFDGRDVRRAAPLYMGIAVAVLAVAAVEALNPAAVHELLNLGEVREPRDGLPSLTSLLQHPIALSTYTTIMSLFLFAGYVVLRRWWMLIGALAFTLTTFLTARRKALLGLVVGLLAGFAAHVGGAQDRARAARRWLPVLGPMVLIGIVFLPSIAGLVARTVDELTDPDTARVVLYQTSVRIAIDRFPLGVGLGRFGSHDSVDPYSPVYAEYGIDDVPGLTAADPKFVKDAFWARVLGETGVLGVCALLVFAVSIAVQLARATSLRLSDPVAAAFVLGATMVFAEALVETFFTSLFDFPPQVHLIFGAAALALGLARTERVRP